MIEEGEICKERVRCIFDDDGRSWRDEESQEKEVIKEEWSNV